jgi:hypothetical protein
MKLGKRVLYFPSMQDTGRLFVCDSSSLAATIAAQPPPTTTNDHDDNNDSNSNFMPEGRWASGFYFPNFCVHSQRDRKNDDVLQDTG